MKKVWCGLAAAFLALVVIGCAAPPPAPAPPAPAPAAPPAAPQPGPKFTPEDAAWLKVVEAAQKEGKLTVYSFSFVGDVGITVSRAFEKTYGIPVDIITGRGAEMLERIKTEARTKNIVADLMETSPTHTTNLKIAGHTVSSLDVPAFQKKEDFRVDPLVNDPEGHVIGHRAMNLPPWVNSKLVRPGEEPKTFKEVLDPKWRGKYVVTDPAVSSGSYNLFMTFVERKLLDLDTVRQIGKNAKYVAGTRQVAEAVARGDYPLGMPSSDNDVAAFLKEGAPLRPVNMEEGTVALSSSIVAVKGAPHPNAAKLFINWIVSQEGQTIYNQVVGLAGIRKDVPDFRPEAGRFVPKRVLAYTEKEATEHAKLMREGFLKELWK